MKAETIIKKLKDLDYKFEVHHHPAVYTVEEAKVYDDKIPGGNCKNMLLCNKKRTSHVLVILEAHKRMDFKKLGEIIGLKGLKFAKEEKLHSLGTFAGSVSPFIILEDIDSDIKVYMDKELSEYDLVNFHPNVNTMTLGLRTEDFLKFMKDNSHDVNIIEY